MNIIVCVKQVAQIYVQSGYDPSTNALVSDGLVYILNPYDEFAVGAAVRQREKAGAGTVSVITIGPSRAEDALRWCLALGADEAVHVVNPGTESPDTWTTALILADLIKQMKFDLLLFGQKAIDDEMGQVGTFVAELLNLPLVTAVTDIDLTGAGTFKVQRALERGDREEVTCPLPAAFTMEKTSAHPKYPTLPAKKTAREKTIRQIDLHSLGSFPIVSKMVTLRLAPPKIKPKRILAPDSDLSDADRMKFIMTGGMGNKQGGTVGGNPEKIVSSIIDFLKEKKLLKTQF